MLFPVSIIPFRGVWVMPASKEPVGKQDRNETELRKVPFTTGSRENLQPGPVKFKVFPMFPNSPVPTRQKATQHRRKRPMVGRGKMEAFPTLSAGGTGQGNRTWEKFSQWCPWPTQLSWPWGKMQPRPFPPPRLIFTPLLLRQAVPWFTY